MTNEAKPAATLILVRDLEQSDNKATNNAFELFMIQRNHQIDFASGALVFPGGKVEKQDKTLSLFNQSKIKNKKPLSPEILSYAVTAIRETFEETGILFAIDKNTHRLISPEQLSKLQKHREELAKGDCNFSELLESENLILDINQLSPFARWITPELMPKRFDTYFFIAQLPEGQEGIHDGNESIHSIWITAEQALKEANSDKYKIIFPTMMNLKRLAEYKNYNAVLNSLIDYDLKAIMPWTENIEGEMFLKIPEDAGYTTTQVPIAEIMRN